MSATTEINGRTLDLAPLCGLQMAHDILAEKSAALIVYEPGDCTRYMIIVAPLVTGNGRTGWLVSRCDGGYTPFGQQVGAVVLENSDVIMPIDVWALCNGNGHTAAVLSGALNVLLEVYR